MNEIDELPKWAGRALQTGPQPLPDGSAPEPPPEPRRGRGRTLLFGLLALLLVAGGALAALLAVELLGDDDQVATDATSSEDASDEEADTATGADDEADETETGADVIDDEEGQSGDGQALDGDDATSDTSAADGELLPPADYVSSDPNFESRIAESDRYAVVRGGEVFLHGFVPSQEFGEQIETISAGVVGPENVTNEYLVDPDTPESDEAPVYVDDRVLFAFNSFEIEEEFFPVLDLGVLLLQQNPTASIEVTSRADATGTEAANQRVSELRGQAVIDYWLSRGVPAEKVTVNAVGETEASDDDDETTAAINRSVDFRVVDVLGDS